jgi:hypothetical protein
MNWKASERNCSLPLTVYEGFVGVLCINYRFYGLVESKLVVVRGEEGRKTAGEISGFAASSNMV